MSVINDIDILVAVAGTLGFLDIWTSMQKFGKFFYQFYYCFLIFNSIYKMQIFISCVDIFFLKIISSPHTYMFVTPFC